MIFRQLFDPVSSTYTYLLGCDESGEAVVIDPVFERHARDEALIRELGLRIRYVLDTHVHADHVTGAWLMKLAYGAQIVLSRRCGVEEVDFRVDDGDVVRFGECALEVRATPGHTEGCVTYVLDDHSMAFTGDCLLIRGAGRTDFQGGSAQIMYQAIHEQIFSLPDECLVYPGHDYEGRTVSTVGEEKRFNSRIGGDAREEDFVGYMDNLGLAHPKLIDIAVPANLRAGRPEDDQLPEKITWGPVTVSFGGIPEIEPEWVARHLEELTVLDVRNAEEFDGELGHVEGSQLIPLDELRDRVGEVPRDRPVVVVCQSGRRSGMAAVILKDAGLKEVANVAGGLINWSRHALPFRS
ncbi:MAG: MBL fold metallo-hydrolase [Gammaproteobacteria bacterium]|nr:MBL fold metallo-hydrolase [Gammaproteobacteria bacterium]